MSTCVLEAEEVDYVAPLLLPFYDAPGGTREEQLTFIGRQLIRENNASHSYNYDHRHDEEQNDPDRYVWQPIMFSMPEDPTFTLFQIDYVDYHSCDRTQENELGETITLWDDMPLLDALRMSQATTLKYVPLGPWEMSPSGRLVNPRGVYLTDSPEWDRWSRDHAWGTRYWLYHHGFNNFRDITKSPIAAD